MKYRIVINLAFSDPDDALDILDKAKDKLDKSVTINPGTPYQEVGNILYQECYHDEDITKPCVLIEEHHTPTP